MNTNIQICHRQTHEKKVQAEQKRLVEEVENCQLFEDVNNKCLRNKNTEKLLLAFFFNYFFHQNKIICFDQEFINQYFPAQRKIYCVILLFLFNSVVHNQR